MWGNILSHIGVHHTSSPCAASVFVSLSVILSVSKGQERDIE
jgi:hypothetical protein